MIATHSKNKDKSCVMYMHLTFCQGQCLKCFMRSCVLFTDKFIKCALLMYGLSNWMYGIIHSRLCLTQVAPYTSVDVAAAVSYHLPCYNLQGFFFQLLTCIGQSWNHIVKTFHTISVTEVFVDQTVNHFPLLSHSIHLVTTFSKIH